MSSCSIASVGLVLVACACTSTESSTPPAASRPDNSKTHADCARDVARILAPLDEQAMRRRGFTATYRVQAGGIEQTVRFAYLAPNRARMVVEEGAEPTTVWVVDGATTSRSEGNGAPRVSRLPASFQGRSQVDPWAPCIAALDAEFPTTKKEEIAAERKSPPDLGSGPSFEFMIRPDPGDPDHDSFETMTYWIDRRFSFLSWLGPLAAWDHAEIEGGSIVRVSRGLTQATISMSTGFLQEMTHGDRFRARLVDFREDADERDFVPPELSKETLDASPEAAPWSDIAAVQLLRLAIYERILSSARLQGSDPERARPGIESVFTALYQMANDRVPSAPARADLESADALVDWFRFFWTASANDPTNRTEIERGCTERRNAIEQRMLEPANAHIKLGKPVVPDRADPSLVARIEQIELETAQAVYRRKFVDPFLSHLDERLKAIRDAK